GADPYDIRDIGPAFLYPPPALFVIEAFNVSESPDVRSLLFLGTNIAVILFILHSIHTHFGYSAREVWFWYPLVLFFAPFLATLHLGQINLITGLGIVLFFTAMLPWLAAMGLALAVITKITPVAFLFYSIVRRDRQTLLYTLLALGLVVAASLLRYGWPLHITYLDVFRDLLDVLPISQNSQSFVSKVWMVFQPSISPSIVQRVFLLYLGLLVLASGILAYRTGDSVPLFIVLGLAVAASPNVMWYHHFVFLLPPLLIWMAWQNLEMGLVLWVIAGLLVVQIDYYYLTTGFLSHLFVQFSILRVIIQQYSKLRVSEMARSVSAA
ncbi:MAG TPA: glycosyltransferase family 87 protein, partial [Anaerolineales bacterium]|nr:glycosyltransferase family 87 protein [Anaerolineales bacterium]